MVSVTVTTRHGGWGQKETFEKMFCARLPHKRRSKNMKISTQDFQPPKSGKIDLRVYKKIRSDPCWVSGATIRAPSHQTLYHFLTFVAPRLLSCKTWIFPFRLGPEAPVFCSKHWVLVQRRYHVCDSLLAIFLMMPLVTILIRCNLLEIVHTRSHFQSESSPPCGHIENFSAFMS